MPDAQDTVRHLPMDPARWTGRDDRAESPRALRWHQQVQPAAQWTVDQRGVVLQGFACDAGVRRNQGRPGAAQGPDAARRALAHLAWHSACPVFDAGDVVCEGDALEPAQGALAAEVARWLDAGQGVLVLGGGHEVAWGTGQGIASHRAGSAAGGSSRRWGIINLDAHFDLRSAPRGSSGTPFAQIAADWTARGWPFDYGVYGISRHANTRALFDTAAQLGVHWVEDHALAPWHLPARLAQLAAHCAELDAIYLTVCLDVLPCSVAPGVSAPAAAGVSLDAVEALIETVASSGKLRVAEIAELSPPHDDGSRTARVAARLAALLADGLATRQAKGLATA